MGQNNQLTKAESGVWEITVGPIDPGAYRYNFNVDGVATIDPRNPAISESNNNVWSLVARPRLGDLRHQERAARGSRRDHLQLDCARQVPSHARLHSAGLRNGTRSLSSVLSAARRRRQRRRLVVSGKGRLHPRQPDRREEGAPDARRDARRPHVAWSPAARSAARRRRNSSTTS